MKIYLVRHGVTQEAKESKLQGPDSPLNNLGKKQAKAVAERLAEEKDIDLVASSNILRARQTAEIIAKKLDRAVEIFQGIHDRQKGRKAHKNPQLARQYIQAWRTRWRNLDWKFDGDDESLRELTDRALRFRNHLLRRHLRQNLVIVSHSFFIGAFVVISVLGENYTDSEFVKLFASLRFANCGLSVLEYDEGADVWKIEVLNEHSYLADSGIGIKVF